MLGPANPCPEGDWPQQRLLVHYRLDQLAKRLETLSDQFDAVSPANLMRENAARRFVWPLVISVIAMAALITDVVIAILQLLKH